MRAIDADALLEQYGLKHATKYGNENAEQQHKSYSTLMMYEIADMIYDAPTIEPTANWTPCSVALPEKDSLYNVTVRVCLLGATIIMTTVKGFDLKLGWSKSEYEDTVLAWQPLPEPYRGEA